MVGRFEANHSQDKAVKKRVQSRVHNTIFLMFNYNDLIYKFI